MKDELERVLADCEVIELDSAERGPACTVVTANQRFLKLTGAAAQIVLAVRAGVELPPGLATSCDVLAQRLATAVAAPPVQPPGFIARRTLLGATTVRALATPLAPLCGPVAMIVIGALAVGALIAVLSTTPPPAFDLATFWLSYAAALPLLLVHELGHAACCVRHGARTGPVGVALYLIYPALYCDVTQAWRLRRWQRVAIDLGGVYLQMIATVVLAFAWRWTGSPVLYGMTAMSIAVATTNLIPFFSLDGYWCLSDALGVVNLRQQRRAVLAGLWARLRRRPARPFPWSPPIVAVVAVYSAAALGFALYVAWRLVPRAGEQLAAIPSHVRLLATAIADREGFSVLAALGRLVTAAIVCVFVLAMLRRAAVLVRRRVGY